MLRQASKNDWSPSCVGRPTVFSDYEEPPTPAEAKALCAGCPMLVLCKTFAQETKVAWGVWAGIAWEDGRQLPRQARRENKDDFVLKKA